MFFLIRNSLGLSCHHDYVSVSPTLETTNTAAIEDVDELFKLGSLLKPSHFLSQC